MERHTGAKWVLLYVARWLKAPMRKQDGTLVARDRGTPQGSAVSPVLANLYLHYAFDRWLAREHPGVTFERYCDDAVIHCTSQAQAVMIRDALAARLAEVGLELHPDKTRVVYCKDADRSTFAFFGDAADRAARAGVVASGDERNGLTGVRRAIATRGMSCRNADTGHGAG